jgi:uncharacterized protein (TIGR03437 family)
VTVGSYLAIYCTGLGAVDNQPAAGAAAPDSPLARVTGAITATIGGQSAQIQFAGLAPRYAGLYQLNLFVPALAPRDYPVQFSVGGFSSNTALISVK